jgi:hypothetical protein
MKARIEQHLLETRSRLRDWKNAFNAAAAKRRP